jgi:hypothetical protein
MVLGDAIGVIDEYATIVQDVKKGPHILTYENYRG